MNNNKCNGTMEFEYNAFGKPLPTSNSISCTESRQQSQQHQNNSRTPLPAERSFVSAVYFTNWSPYKKAPFFPHYIDTKKITHVYYAFLNINGDTGCVESHDSWADFELPVSTDKELEGSSPGCIAELFHLKIKHRFKVIMSIGGWSNKDNFRKALLNEKMLQTLVKTSVEQMFSLGFDGIDLDFEYPETEMESSQYLKLAALIRKQLDDLEYSIFGVVDSKFELSVAVPGFKEGLQRMKIKEMDQFVTYWNMMTYDYYGAWSTQTGYHSGLFDSLSYSVTGTMKHDNAGRLCGDDITTFMISKLGISPKKIVLGIGTHGRSFTNVAQKSNSSSYIGLPFQGTGPGETEEGVWPYNSLPLKGTKEEYDTHFVSAYCFNKSTRTLVTYDNATSVNAKANYIETMNLAGGFIWDISGDKMEGAEDSLLCALYKGLSRTIKKEKSAYSERETLHYYLSNYGSQQNPIALLIRKMYKNLSEH